MILIAKWITITFGIFFFAAGLIMLLAPKRARYILRKAGSTNFINYAEITIRLIPAIGIILAADISRSPVVFKIVGWFMLCTSIVLYFIPRKLHHSFSLKAAEILKPLYFQLISPIAFIIGAAIIYSVI